MPDIELMQPSLRSDVEKLSLLVFRDDFESAEGLAHSIYKRLSKRNN